MTTTPHSELTTTSELPIYQGLLDELDPAARATVIEQQGEGHDTGDAPPDEKRQHLAQPS